VRKRLRRLKACGYKSRRLTCPSLGAQIKLKLDTPEGDAVKLRRLKACGYKTRYPECSPPKVI